MIRSTQYASTIESCVTQGRRLTQIRSGGTLQSTDSTLLCESDTHSEIIQYSEYGNIISSRQGMILHFAPGCVTTYLLEVI